MALTIEDFATRVFYLRTVGGDDSLAMPCCANCKHYESVEHVCIHPAEEYQLDSMLRMKPEDFCSRFEKRTDG